MNLTPLPMKKLLVALIVCSMAFAAQAKEPSFKTLAKIATAYVAVVGCMDTDVKIDPKNVTKFRDQAAGVDDAFIVLVPADITCAGGSGTGSMNIILLEHAGNRDVEMDPDYKYLNVNVQMSEPVAYANSPRAVTSIYQKNGQLFATGLDYGPNDSNCCPSLRTLYKVELKKRSMEISKSETRDLYSWYFTKMKNY